MGIQKSSRKIFPKTDPAGAVDFYFLGTCLQPFDPTPACFG